MTSNDQDARSNNPIIEARLERPGGSYNTVDTNPYLAQLIDMLQRKNRNLALFLILSLLIAVGVGFYAFKLYYDNNFLNERLKEITSKSETLQSDNNQYQAQLSQLQEEVSALVENNAVELSLKSPTELSVLAESQSKTAQLKSLMRETKLRLDALEQDKSDLADELAKSNTDKQKMKASYVALQNSISEKSEELATTMEMIDEINTEKDNVLKELQRNLEMFKNENVSLQKEINKRKSAFDALAKRYQQTKDSLDNSYSKANKLSNDLKAKQVELQSTASSLASTQKELGRVKSLYNELEASLKAITQPIKRNSPAAGPTTTLTP